MVHAGFGNAERISVWIKSLPLNRALEQECLVHGDTEREAKAITNIRGGHVPAHAIMAEGVDRDLGVG